MVDVLPVLPTLAMYTKAVRVLRQGGVVAYPTETFYGLAVDPTNTVAVSTLYDLKKRDPDKALTYLIPDQSSLYPFVRSIPEVYSALMAAFWPGPLTLVFEANEKCIVPVKKDDNSLAIRISSSPVAQAFCQQWGDIITASSANISGEPPLSTAEDVKKLWGDSIDYILDGGNTQGGKPSTIVKYGAAGLSIVREGVIPAGTISKSIS